MFPQEAKANMRAMEAVYSNKITTAQAQRDYLLKKAIYDQETFTKKASSDLAYELQSAKTQQRIKEETMQIKVRVHVILQKGVKPFIFANSRKGMVLAVLIFANRRTTLEKYFAEFNFTNFSLF